VGAAITEAREDTCKIEGALEVLISIGIYARFTSNPIYMCLELTKDTAAMRGPK